MTFAWRFCCLSLPSSSFSTSTSSSVNLVPKRSRNDVDSFLAVFVSSKCLLFLLFLISAGLLNFWRLRIFSLRSSASGRAEREGETAEDKTRRERTSHPAGWDSLCKDKSQWLHQDNREELSVISESRALFEERAFQPNLVFSIGVKKVCGYFWYQYVDLNLMLTYKYVELGVGCCVVIPGTCYCCDPEQDWDSAGFMSQLYSLLCPPHCASHTHEATLSQWTGQLGPLS